MRVTGLRELADGVLVSTTSGLVRLQGVGPTIMRVTATARDDFVDAPGAAVLPQRHTALEVAERNDALLVTAGALSVRIDRTCGAFTWLDADGHLVVREPHDGGSTRVLEEIDVVRYRYRSGARRTAVAGVDGLRSGAVHGEPYVDRRAYATTVRLEFAPGEVLHGLGQHDDGIFDYRGHSQELYQQNMKVAVPVLVSTRGYALAWDSASFATFTDGPDGARFSTAVDDELDYYVVLGPELDDVMAGLRRLTGRVPMLPRWALGYLQSKERYESAQELLDVVAEFRRRGIPLDCVVQDWRSWPGELWGQKSFDPVRYPDPSRLCAQLHGVGVRLMVSIWPNLHNDGPDHVELRGRGCLLGDDSTYDPWSPLARSLYWEQARAGYFDHGVDAWWTDCTEPFEADWHGAVKPSRETRRELNVGEAAKYLDPEHLNEYSLMHTRGIVEGQRGADPARRVFVLTRSASLGQQRYGAVTWSGDISATWATLRDQLAEGLNFCLTGNPRWTFDIGAFFVGNDPQHWFWSGDFPDGLADPGYRELYVRWLQAATFLPVMRSHGTETPREPWRFGEPGDPHYDAIIAFIRLRYRLLPYLYSLHAAETLRDYTSLRALCFDFRSDSAALGVSDQFMLGPALMVCPVTEPIYFGPRARPLAGPARRRVYLPAGIDWYDFWTGRRHRGGRTIEAPAPLDRIPVYIRSGAILPLAATDGVTTEQVADAPLEIVVHPGRNGSFELYDDSGDTYGYERGDYSLTTLTWDDRTRALRASAPRGTWTRSDGEGRVAVVASGASGALSVSVRRTITLDRGDQEVRIG